MADDWAPISPQADDWAPVGQQKEKPYSPPSTMDYLMAGPGGALLQPSERAGQAMIRLPMHAASAISDLGGMYPNQVSDKLRAWTDAVDKWTQSQNQSYEDARNKFVNPASRAYETIGSAAPGMLAGAVAGAPAVASSTLGNITQGALTGAKGGAIMGALSDNAPANENYWTDLVKRSGLGAVTGAVTGGAVNAGAPKAAPPPTSMDFKTQSGALYKAANDAGVTVKNDSLKNFSDDLTKTIADEGMSKRLHTGALGALQDIQDAADSGQPITLKGLDLLRQNVGDVAATAKTAGERRIAGLMRDKMDDYMERIGPTDALGDPGDAFHLLSQARDLWGTYRKSSLIDQMMEKAQNASGANYSQAGYETALRRQFRQLADNQAKMRGFSPEEQQAILQVTRGGPIDNAMRSLGRFVTRGPVSGALTVGATALAGPGAGAAMAGATEGARALATRGTLNNITDLQNLVKGYTPGVASPTATLPGAGVLGNPAILRLLQSGLINTAIPPILYGRQQVGNE